MNTAETREQRLLYALVLMVQYLENDEDEVDSLSMSAGEHAIKSLAEYGLLDVEGEGRLGRWTGNDFWHSN